MGQVYRSALNGQCKDRPDVPMPLTATLAAVKLRVAPVADASTFRRLFEPLGYVVEARLVDAADRGWRRGHGCESA